MKHGKLGDTPFARTSQSVESRVVAVSHLLSIHANGLLGVHRLVKDGFLACKLLLAESIVMLCNALALFSIGLHDFARIYQLCKFCQRNYLIGCKSNAQPNLGTIIAAAIALASLAWA